MKQGRILSLARVGVTVVTLLASMSGIRAEAPSEPCHQPFVFPGAAVNTVVLPYRYAGSREGRFKETGNRLSFLVHLETFVAMLKYGSIGGVRLIEDRSFKEGCEPSTVYSQLVGQQPGAAAQIEPGNALVLLWGRIYEEGEDVFVQSYLRFVRLDEEESLELAVGEHRLRGRLPFQSLAFPARWLSQNDLEQIEKEALEAAEIREKPSTQSKPRPLRVDHNQSQRYGVVSQEKRWIQVRDSSTGATGWIKYGHDPEAWSLQEQLPELAFVDGIVGYLRSRVAGESRSDWAKWSFEALRRYEELETEAAREPLALSKSLTGFLTVLQSPQSRSSVVKARGDFELAEALVPYSADARTLGMISDVYIAYTRKRMAFLRSPSGKGAAELKPRTVADEFLQVASLEPSNEMLLENLETVYRLFEEQGQAGVEAEYALEEREIKEQMAVIEGITNKE